MVEVATSKGVTISAPSDGFVSFFNSPYIHISNKQPWTYTSVHDSSALKHLLLLKAKSEGSIFLSHLFQSGLTPLKLSIWF